MKYTLRNYENNFQIVASLGWLLVIMSVALLFIKGQPAVLVLGAVGGLLIWWQLRGKRVTVDTGSKTIKAGLKTIALNGPRQVLLKKIKVSQNLNSRGSTANVKSEFYVAFILDGDDRHQISSNRKPERDMDKLKQIADDLKVELVVNY